MLKRLLQTEKKVWIFLPSWYIETSCAFFLVCALVGLEGNAIEIWMSIFCFTRVMMQGRRSLHPSNKGREVKCSKSTKIQWILGSIVDGMDRFGLRFVGAHMPVGSGISLNVFMLHVRFLFITSLLFWLKERAFVLSINGHRMFSQFIRDCDISIKYCVTIALFLAADLVIVRHSLSALRVSQANLGSRCLRSSNVCSSLWSRFEKKVLENREDILKGCLKARLRERLKTML